MKKLILLLLIIPVLVNAQKPTIKLDTYKEWPTVTGGNLNNEGSYAYYFINNSPVGHNTFVIVNPRTEEKVMMKDVSSPAFSDDSKLLYGKLPNDTMFIYHMHTKELKKISNVSNFIIFKTGGYENIAMATTKKKLILNIGKSNRTKAFENVEDYKISQSGNAIAIKTKSDTDTTNREILTWFDVQSSSAKTVFKAEMIDNIIFDRAGKQLAFFATQHDIKTIWHFDNNKPYASEIVSSDLYKNEINELDYNLFTFSLDGKFIFFTTGEKKNPLDSILSIQPETWNYEDKYLKSQLTCDFPLRLTRQDLYSVNIEKRIVVSLLHGNQKILFNTFKPITDDYIVIADSDGDLADKSSSSSKITYLLCSTKTGSVRAFTSPRNTVISQIQISPSSKYINYYDPEKDSYVGYNINTKKTVNLTTSLHHQLIDYDRIQEIKPEIYSLGIAGYLGNDENIIIRGTYDLWSISQDPSKLPINLTQGRGYKEKIVFGPVKENKQLIYRIGEPVILTGFNTNSKEFGFYKLEHNGKTSLSKLSSGNYCISTPLNPYGLMSPIEFIRAKNGPAFLILRQSANSSPNYYYSKDLIKFKNLSNITPERDYNWLTAELLHFSDGNGNKYSGIIYKPENFNPNKKYPIIFNYYERLSNGVNIYPKPEPISTNLNIAMAVSNEYIVFLPDMKTSYRSSGEEALKTAISSVKFLSQNSWIDTTKMALMGHSYGGFETNYIVSHTNMFAAAISGAGISDLVSMAYELWGSNGTSLQQYFQFAAPQLVEPLADNPNIYIQNSPILNAKNIITPMLLVHNDQDRAVPFRQSRQMFIALRSLNKPVWLLNYKGESHGLGKEENISDYNKKIFGFFDYYLKNKPKPQWMVSHN